MGMIKIETWGSFPSRSKQLSAMGNGHAHAVTEAIQFLTNEVLPAAIEQDHRLHDDGAKPNNGFGRPFPSAIHAAMKAAGWSDTQVGAAMDAAGTRGY